MEGTVDSDGSNVLPLLSKYFRSRCIVMEIKLIRMAKLAHNNINLCAVSYSLPFEPSELCRERESSLLCFEGVFENKWM